MKINPWTSFTLLHLDRHLYAAPFLSVCPDGVLAWSNHHFQEKQSLSLPLVTKEVREKVHVYLYEWGRLVYNGQRSFGSFTFPGLNPLH